MKKMLLLLIALTVPMFTVAQTDVSTILKGGEIILSGLSILKAAKSDPKSEEKKNSKIIESVCVKNKLLLGITIRITGKDEEGNDKIDDEEYQEVQAEPLFRVVGASRRRQGDARSLGLPGRRLRPRRRGDQGRQSDGLPRQHQLHAVQQCQAREGGGILRQPRPDGR